MGKRKYITRFKCGFAGCEEIGLYESDTRADQAKLNHIYFPDKWRCVRHTRPSEVLGADNPKLTYEMKVFQVPHGKFWGTDKASVGFVSGPGFKAFAKDFAEGTVIRVTAEILLTCIERDL